MLRDKIEESNQEILSLKSRIVTKQDIASIKDKLETILEHLDLPPEE